MIRQKCETGNLTLLVSRFQFHPSLTAPLSTMADLSDDLADLSLLARPGTMTAEETVSLNRLFDSLHSAGQNMGRAYANQCQAVYLSEEERKTKRDSDDTSPDLKAICGNAGDFYECVVASRGCAMSKGGYLCVKNNRRHPPCATHSYQDLTLPPPNTHTAGR